MSSKAFNTLNCDNIRDEGFPKEKEKRVNDLDLKDKN